MSLPPNWASYKTDDGKEYYHNTKTNVTQWEKPAWPESTGDVYQYKPPADLEMTQGGTIGLDNSQSSSGTAGVATLQVDDSARVSLRNNPTGQIGSGGGNASASVASGYSMAGAAFNAVTSEDGAGMNGFFGGILSSAQTLFDVGTDDVVKRLKASVIPMRGDMASQGATNDFRARPDFWGPFWVATTAVLFLAATGNFARLVKTGDHSTFKANYGLVSLAACMVYGCLIGVPLFARAALCLTGQEANSINFRQMICVYGYSLTSTIPVSILCIVPWAWARHIFVLLGFAISALFIRSNLWSDISVEAPSLKWTLVAALCGSQAVIFGIYRFHFFSAA
eukprot:TRINITY_DN55852_c0_g1_i1.p1 TRINITY_DN55852_c0_g1~~TRINITY_DN55852_c0_g1_i1.p1  ORF type:complete len:338 (+),score=62.77 TRINITY_DN55852_c0_g1_i1:89-1102(+)